MTATRLTYALGMAGLISLVSIPAPAFASSILLITAGDPTNNAMLVSTLQAQGDTVTVGPTFSNFTGAGLSGYNEVMLIPGYSAAANAAPDMPGSGQQALLNFVKAGGGLVTGEGLVQNSSYPKEFQTLSAAIPAQFSNISTGNTAISFSTLATDPTITKGLPSSFSFTAANPNGGTTETYFLPKAGATPLFTTNQWTSTFGGYGTGSGAVNWSYGLGRVISLSTASDTIELANPTYAQMLRDAANWASNSTGAPPVTTLPLPPPMPTPEPTTLAILGLGIAGILARKWARRTGE